MEQQELLWSSSQQELVRGIALRDGQYRCLLCGAAFPQGEVFPRGGRFYDAEAMAALHLREAHGSMLEYLPPEPRSAGAVRGSVGAAPHARGGLHG